MVTLIDCTFCLPFGFLSGMVEARKGSVNVDIVLMGEGGKKEYGEGFYLPIRCT